MKHSLPTYGAALLVCGVTLAPSPVEAQENRPTFSAGVALVPITAVVRDSRRRIVRELSRDDFVVLENNQPRPILDFRATSEGPVSVALLFDTSGSMRGPNLTSGKVVVDRLLATLTQPADEVALFTFDKAIRQETPFTSVANAVRTALEQSDAWGLTSLYDAIADTARRLADRRGERRAVIVVTDGIDTSSTMTATDVSGLASAIDVPVYVVAVMPTRRTDRDATRPARSNLSDLALWTGGDLRYATDADDANQVVAALMSELRQQYFLAIESSSASGWHRIDVTTKRRDLKVRTRSGYFSATAIP